MTILTIRTVGDPVLRTPCDPITVFDQDLCRLVHDMLETMYAVEGVGLAGPQVGIAKQIFTFGNIDGLEGHVINPVIEIGDEPQEGGEGCLSVPGLSAATPRKNWARVTGLTCEGQPVTYEGQGLFARMLQHETDHLHGTMFIDRLVGEDKKNVWRKIRQSSYNEVAAAVQGERAAQASSVFGALGGSLGAGQGKAARKPGSFGI
ncbi:peptide deformylase [Rothia sp. P5766]|uniref:peptide deformylase n=1 Tax=unclassified Rothia (in: high G+C Gram-positive bacteria) TaxID=2689056 RepID=UPI003AE65B36